MRESILPLFEFTHSHNPGLETAPRPSSTRQGAFRLRTLQLFRTPRNVFGLSRQYHSTEFPSHDPETAIDVRDLSEPLDVAAPPALPSDAPLGAKESFYPYPNWSSFQLGDWYWNGGPQKSQESFKALLSIIGDPDFMPEDVRRAQWPAINRILANDPEEGKDEHEWLDKGAG